MADGMQRTRSRSPRHYNKANASNVSSSGVQSQTATGNGGASQSAVNNQRSLGNQPTLQASTPMVTAGNVASNDGLPPGAVRSPTTRGRGRQGTAFIANGICITGCGVTIGGATITSNRSLTVYTSSNGITVCTSNGSHGNRSSDPRTQDNSTVIERPKQKGDPTYITTSDGKLDLSNVDADGPIVITAETDIEISGHRGGSGSLDITAEGKVMLTGGANTSGPISIVAEGSVAVNWMRNSGPVSIKAEGSVTVSDARSSGLIDVKAEGNVKFDRLRASGSLNIKAEGNITFCDAHSDGSIAVKAEGNVDLSGLRGSGPLRVKCEGSVNNAGRNGRTGPTSITDCHSGSFFGW